MRDCIGDCPTRLQESPTNARVNFPSEVSEARSGMRARLVPAGALLSSRTKVEITAGYESTPVCLMRRRARRLQNFLHDERIVNFVRYV